MMAERQPVMGGLLHLVQLKCTCTYLLIYLLTYLFTYLLIYLLTYLFTCLLACLLTYLLTNLFIYLHTYVGRCPFAHHLFNVPNLTARPSTASVTIMV